MKSWQTEPDHRAHDHARPGRRALSGHFLGILESALLPDAPEFMLQHAVLQRAKVHGPDLLWVTPWRARRREELETADPDQALASLAKVEVILVRRDGVSVAIDYGRVEAAFESDLVGWCFYHDQMRLGILAWEPLRVDHLEKIAREAEKS